MIQFLFSIKFQVKILKKLVLIAFNDKIKIYVFLLFSFIGSSCFGSIVKASKLFTYNVKKSNSQEIMMKCDWNVDLDSIPELDELN